MKYTDKKIHSVESVSKKKPIIITEWGPAGGGRAWPLKPGAGEHHGGGFVTRLGLLLYILTFCNKRIFKTKKICQQLTVL